MRQNAAQLNRMQIREQEALNRQRRSQDDAESRRDTQALRRTQAQYDHVTSHGYGRGGTGSAAGAGGPPSSSPGSAPTAASGSGGRRGSANAGVVQGDDVHIKVYVRECDEEMGQTFTYQESGSGARGAAAAPSGGAPRGTRGTADPPKHSAQPSVASRLSGSGGASRSDEVIAPNRTRVPRYLQQRKAEMAAEKAAVAAEAELQRQLSQIPPGHRKVTEDEKADTLRRVDERQHELEAQLAKIPIRFDTQAIQQRRRAIEDELRDLETKRSKYSTKNPLYVPLN